MWDTFRDPTAPFDTEPFGRRFFEVGDRSFQPVGIVVELAEPGVAVDAEESSDSPGSMVVVNMEGSIGPRAFLAHGAEPTLRLLESGELLEGHVVLLAPLKDEDLPGREIGWCSELLLLDPFPSRGTGGAPWRPLVVKPLRGLASSTVDAVAPL